MHFSTRWRRLNARKFHIRREVAKIRIFCYELVNLNETSKVAES
jgi:hypothetical protein